MQFRWFVNALPFITVVAGGLLITDSILYRGSDFFQLAIGVMLVILALFLVIVEKE